MKEKKTHILRTTLVAFFGLAVTIVLFFIGSVSIQGLGLCNVESEYMIATNDLGNMFGWFQNLTSGNVFLSTWIFLGLFILAIIGIIFAIIVMIKKRSGKAVGYGIVAIIFIVALYWLMSCFGTIQINANGSYENYVLACISFNAYDFNGLIPTTDLWAGIYYIALVVAVLFTLISAMVLTCQLTRIAGKKKKVAAVTKETVKVEEKAVENTTASQETKDEEVKTVQETSAPKRKVVLTVKRFDSYGKDYPVIERRCCNYPNESLATKALTRDDLREIIRDELERREALNQKAAFEEKTTRNIVNQPTVTIDEHKKDTGKSEIPTPVVVTIPTPIKKEVAEETEVKEEKTKSLTKDDIKNIIQEELANVIETLKASIPATKKEPKTIVVTVPRQVVEKTVVEDKVCTCKEEKVAVEETKNDVVTSETKEEVKTELVVKEEVKVEPVEAKEEVKAVETSKPVVNEAKEANTEVIAETNEEGDSTKVERIPFTTRMKDASPELRDHYNSLKSLLKSYGLKNRVANGGDTFRLHRVTYCKLTIAGKALKLYLALDPEDYKNTTLPIKDVSTKAIYKDIPLVFKVKSELSFRRAEQLIRDCMEKHGVEQIDQVRVEDWASKLDEEMTQDVDDEE